MPIPGAPDPDDLNNKKTDDFDGSDPRGGKMKMWWAVLISLVVVISAIMLLMQGFESGIF